MTLSLIGHCRTNRAVQSIDSGPSGTRTVSSGVNGNYRNDGNLKRVRAQVDGKTIYNVYDLSGALVHVDKTTDTEETDYVSGPNGTLARITNNVVTYLHSDPLGLASSGTNASGTKVWTASRDTSATARRA